MEFWKNLYNELLKREKNNHPLDLKSCVYICELINKYKIKNILEIGTGLGFSSYFFAKNSFVEEIDTIEKNKEYFSYAQELDDTHKINYINLDLFEYRTDKKYDLIFIDGPKRNQDKILEHVSEFLSNSGLIVIDNIFLNRVKEKNNKQSKKILLHHDRFLKYLNNNSMFDVKYIDIDDGLAILKRKNMKIAVTCCNLELGINLAIKKIDNIIVGLRDFSCRFNNYFDFEEIEQLIESKQESKITVCINDIFFEESIPKLENAIKRLVALKVDCIMFHDFAVAQIVKENNFDIELHYNPETLVTSYGQFEFYLKNNIKNVSIASELTMSELKKIHENKQNMTTYIKAYGLGFVMHSRWPMVSNFREHISSETNIYSKKFNSIEYLLIKEDLRVMPNILYEDKYGTHMLTGYYICGIKKINEFKTMNVDYLLIDAFFIHDIELYTIIDKFVNANKNNLSNEELENYFNEIEKNAEHKISEGFFGSIQDRLHMLKEEKNE